MFRIYCLITILLFTSCACADEGNNEVEDELLLPDAFHQLEIVNGTDAEEGEFPFAVSFVINL